MHVSFVALMVAVTFQAPAASHRVGIGVTMPDAGVFLPINVSSRVRLEPFVNFQSSRLNQATSDTSWYSFTEVGLGVFSVSHPQERINLYFGPRGGMLHVSRKINGSGGQASSKDSGWFIAGAAGGEYSPAPRFSMGAEAKIQYDHASSTSTGAFQIGPSLYTRSWFSSGVLVVRFYP